MKNLNLEQGEDIEYEKGEKKYQEITGSGKKCMKDSKMKTDEKCYGEKKSSLTSILMGRGADTGFVENFLNSKSRLGFSMGCSSAVAWLTMTEQHS